ncbi:MAG: hypothetical protein JWQ21_2591 [Herminiimonas sp.]|nr:hypothetical protein [Herminiimonas sp.]
MTMWNQLLAGLDQLFNRTGCCSTVLTTLPSNRATASTEIWFYISLLRTRIKEVDKHTADNGVHFL